jgi:antirestriction protein ArdC
VEIIVESINKVYQIITDRIIAALDKGTVPWHKPWRGGSDGAPASLVSKKSYRGVNVFLLGMQQQMMGYKSRFWLTYKQAQSLKGSVKRGEKGTPVIFWMLMKKEDKNGSEKSKQITIPILRYYTVFNVDQCENIKDPEVSKGESLDFNPIARCEDTVKKYDNAPSMTSNEQRAFYRPADDSINMPRSDSFESVEAYYSVLFHELTHSTGHNSRLNRPGLKSPMFGTETYSKEELIAEMGAAMLCSICGIDNATFNNSASYIASWKSKLTEDPKLLVHAAAAAQKAADFIQGIKFADKEE